jgi:hypothetical protein
MKGSAVTGGGAGKRRHCNTLIQVVAQPTLALETELADTDEYEVRIYDMRQGKQAGDSSLVQ